MEQSRFDFVLERPVNMDFKEYKQKQKLQNEKLKNYLQIGRYLSYKSWSGLRNKVTNTFDIKRFAPAKVTFIDNQKRIYKPQNR
jgi:dynactin complex subunit